jgi:hypothetical protein
MHDQRQLVLQLAQERLALKPLPLHRLPEYTEIDLEALPLREGRWRQPRRLLLANAARASSGVQRGALCDLVDEWVLGIGGCSIRTLLFVA